WRPLAALGLLATVTAGLADPLRQEAMAQAERLRESGDHAATVAVLTRWVDDHPGDADAQLQLGQAHVDAGDPEAGLAAWRRLLKRQPPRGHLFRSVGDRCRRLGLYRDAIEILEEGRDALDDPRLYTWELTELHLVLEEYDAAVEGLIELLRQEPQRLGLVEGRLLNLVRRDRTAAQRSGGTEVPRSQADGLLEALERAVAGELVADDQLLPRVLLAGVALEAGRDQRALSVLTSVAHLPDVAPFIYQFASRCEATGYERTAAAAYSLYLEHAGDSPSRFQALLRQAGMEERGGRPERATALYRQLAEDFPGRPEAPEALVQASRLQLEKGGNPKAARASLKRAAALDHSGRLQGHILRLLAACDLQDDELADARDRYERLLGVGPDNLPEALLGLTEIAFYEGEFEAASSHADSLLALEPAHSLANNALALQLLIDEYGDSRDALSAYGRALLRERQGRRQDAAEHWRWLEERAPAGLRQRSLLTRAGMADPSEALTLYGQVLASNPAITHAVEAHLGRARALERLGRSLEALRAYEEALLAYPEAAQAPQVRLEVLRLRQLHGGERPG
ncbi:tetratricopeptide repeat protein, partial [Candidatus Latescibacterota bacterium]